MALTVVWIDLSIELRWVNENKINPRIKKNLKLNIYAQESCTILSLICLSYQLPPIYQEFLLHQSILLNAWTHGSSMTWHEIKSQQKGTRVKCLLQMTVVPSQSFFQHQKTKQKLYFKSFEEVHGNSRTCHMTWETKVADLRTESGKNRIGKLLLAITCIKFMYQISYNSQPV